MTLVNKAVMHPNFKDNRKLLNNLQIFKNCTIPFKVINLVQRHRIRNKEKSWDNWDKRNRIKTIGCILEEIHETETIKEFSTKTLKELY